MKSSSGLFVLGLFDFALVGCVWFVFSHLILLVDHWCL